MLGRRKQHDHSVDGLRARHGLHVVAAIVPFVCAACMAHAQTRVSAQFAEETRGGIERAELGLSIPTGWRGQLGSASWSANFNVDVARWHATTHDGAHSHVFDVGVTPQSRLLSTRGSIRPYVEAGIGAHWLSAHDIGDLQLGSGFQFGEYLGVGAAFGDDGRFTTALRLLHESNCGIRRSNSGLTAVGLRFEYALR